MQQDFEEGVSDEEKIVEFLLNNDTLLQEASAVVVPKYNKDQLLPVKTENDRKCLISEYNEVEPSRFYDPDTKQVFKFDHMRCAVSEISTVDKPPIGDDVSGAWRTAVNVAWGNYVQNHYKEGVSNVFDRSDDENIVIVACVECHAFQEKNFWNGRWRSVWTLTIPRSASKEAGDRSPKADVSGLLRVQVHYYEDGNVQLMCSKEVKDTVDVTSESETAREFVKAVEEAENAYQTAIGENYQTMSDSTFKALRRPLPLTRTKIDWTKILTYRVLSEMHKN